MAFILALLHVKALDRPTPVHMADIVTGADKGPWADEIIEVWIKKLHTVLVFKIVHTL